MTYQPRIVSAAMLMDDGLIVPGVRHFSSDMRAVLERIYGRGLRLFGRWVIKPYHLKVKEQGFIDTHGNFLDRRTAYERVLQTGQCPQFAKGGGPGDTTILYSEDCY